MVAAILAVVLALVSGVFEIYRQWPREPQLVISLKLSPRPWAGFYDDGSPVERVIAKIGNYSRLR